MGLRTARDNIVNDAANGDDENPLSERLIAREVRRERREELRSHFNHKYFNGRTPDGEETPTIEEQRRPRAELPSYVRQPTGKLARHANCSSGPHPASRQHDCRRAVRLVRLGQRLVRLGHQEQAYGRSAPCKSRGLRPSPSARLSTITSPAPLWDSRRVWCSCTYRRCVNY